MRLRLVVCHWLEIQWLSRRFWAWIRMVEVKVSEIFIINWLVVWCRFRCYELISDDRGVIVDKARRDGIGTSKESELRRDYPI